MSPEQLSAAVRSMFPKASKSFVDANPALSLALGRYELEEKLQVNVARSSGKRRGLLNATEREFAMILESQKRKGEIHSYEFEGITLRFASVAYTPDFAVFPPALCVSGQIKLIEVKGPYIKGKFERAVERFRHAKTYYGDRFLFEMHQKTRAEGWKRLL